MTTRTYLHDCLRDGHSVRWPDSAMPLRVYIAPFTWYEKSKQQESQMYRQMVLDSLAAWRKATNGKVQFHIVDNMHLSQIDFKWRRVNRQSLGHCLYEFDEHFRLFTAEIQIGISDGLLHADYQDAGEVQHTIIHEIGHALGLIGHSDHPKDIMYVPHQYGVHRLSDRDVETIQWLYKLPVGFNYVGVGQKYNLPQGFNIHQVIEAIHQRQTGTTPKPEAHTPQKPSSSNAPSPKGESQVGVPPSGKKPYIQNTQSLEEQHQILSEMGRFYLKTQHISQTPKAQENLRKLLDEGNKAPE